MLIQFESELGALAAEWDALADELSAPPFLRPGWIELWWSAFGRGELVALTARGADGALRGALPLARRRKAMVSPTNDHTPLFGFLGDADAVRALTDRLNTAGGRRVVLTHLDDRSYGALDGGRRLVAKRGRIDSPCVEIHGSWESYEASLGSNLRGDLRRRQRRLSEAGATHIDLDAPLDALEEGLRIEGSGWKDAAGTAIRSRPDTLAFYRGLAEWASARGMLRLCLLRVDERPAAFHFDLLDDGVLYHLKGGFDTAYERLSPGKVLHHAALRAAWERGDRRYEFLGPPDRYKLQFANAHTTVHHVELFPRTAPGALGYAAVSWGRPAAKRVVVTARAAGARAVRRSTRTR